MTARQYLTPCYLILILLCSMGIAWSAPGDVFYSEDFSAVKEGYLPSNWSGGEKLMVYEDRGKKFVSNFEGPSGYNDLYSFFVRGVNFPKNYEFEYVISLKGTDGMFFSFCKVGGINISLNWSEAKLQDASVGINSNDLYGKVIRVTIKKEASLFSFYVDGQRLLIGRYPKISAKSESFSMGFTNGSRLYSIKGTELADPNEAGEAPLPIRSGLGVRATIYFEGGTAGSQIDKATGQMVFNDSSIEVSVPVKNFKESAGRIFMDKDGRVDFQMPDFPLAALPVTADVTFKRTGFKTVTIRNVTVTSTDVKLPNFTMPKQ